MALISVALLCACGAEKVHTLENTRNLTRNQLAALCSDLKMRAEQDCRWNMRQQQSSIDDQQTWEINCRSRRDSARESFDNVCFRAHFEEAEIRKADH